MPANIFFRIQLVVPLEIAQSGYAGGDNLNAAVVWKDAKLEEN
jgi:hypothetical protein